MKDQSDEVGLKVLGFIGFTVILFAILGFFLDAAFYTLSLTSLYVLALIVVVGNICSWLDNRQEKKK